MMLCRFDRAVPKYEERRDIFPAIIEWTGGEEILLNPDFITSVSPLFQSGGVAPRGAHIVMNTRAAFDVFHTVDTVYSLCRSTIEFDTQLKKVR